MPQMMPINWIILFLFFSIIFIMFIIMNYYNYNMNNKILKNNNFQFNKNKLNWKW
uniref:ATP synthase complex subunit 8 n=1 Tax=Gibbovalva kobusi TaxID=1913583 RepID=A0A650FEM5_9NEOP|nr:ATP synthase F0 subunit 8 [Gibbovalva kobusi]